MMSNIAINDLNLLRFGKASVEGVSLDTYKKSFPKDEFVCFGQYKENKEPLWVVFLHSFKKNHDCLIEMAFNKDGLFSAQLFKMIGNVLGDYLFNQANLMRCSARIRESNKASLRLAQSWGFVIEGIIRKGFKSPKVEDMYVLGLLKEECKWVQGDKKWTQHY